MAGRVEASLQACRSSGSRAAVRRSMHMTSSSQQQAGTGPAADGSDLDALMQANIVRVFNERDPDRRRAALGELYTENATLCYPETVATGRGALSGAIGGLHRP